MNILWLSHFVPYPPKGGMLQRSYNLLREAAKENRVFLLAMRQKAIHPMAEDVSEAVSHLGKLCEYVKVIDNPWERHPIFWYYLVFYSIFTKKPYTVNWTTSGRMREKVQHILNNEKIDLIHYDTVGLGEYVFGENGIPRALNHHNIESDLMLRRAEKEGNPIKKLYYLMEGKKLANYERSKCRLFQKNITVAEVDSEVLCRLVPGLDISEIPNGVDIDYFKPQGIPIRKNRLVFAGSLNWYPNVKAVEYLCSEIWPLLKRAVPGAGLLIVGRNPSPEFIKKYNAVDGVEVLADVDDIRPYIEEAEVYVCPIRHSGGTKLKILDALAMEKAIVAHPVACEGIDVRHEKNVLLAETTEKFVEAIVKLLGDAELRVQLGKNGRQLVEEKYAYSFIGKKLNCLYEELLTYVCRQRNEKGVSNISR